MVNYKLHYFPARARAEPQRLIFAAAGQPYEDIRHGHDGEAWASFKPKTQIDKLPMLEIFDDDGNLIFTISQSMAIGRLLAKEFNLAGTNKYEQAEADMYVDQGQDLKAEYKKYKEQGGDLPNSFKIFENKLKSSNTGFVVGDGLTYADLELFDMIDKAAPHHSIIFQNYPLIEKHFNLVKNIPNIAKWLVARPVTSM